MERVAAFVSGNRRPNTTVEVCCSIFAHAMQSGTDNEGYGSLISLYSNDPSGVTQDAKIKWMIGSGLPEPFFCPWCGATIEIKEV